MHEKRTVEQCAVIFLRCVIYYYVHEKRIPEKARLYFVLAASRRVFPFYTVRHNEFIAVTRSAHRTRSTVNSGISFSHSVRDYKA